MTEQDQPGAGTVAADPADIGRRRGAVDSMRTVRASDLEPYTGLRYLSTLFRVMAILLVLLLIAEGVAGALAAGRAAVPTLLAEASRLLVLAGILWGAGDLAVLLVDIGHDVRATRIMLGRQSGHHEHDDESTAVPRHGGRVRAVDLRVAESRPERPADLP